MVLIYSLKFAENICAQAVVNILIIRVVGHYAEDMLEELMRESDIVTEENGCPHWGKLKPQPNRLCIRIL